MLLRTGRLDIAPDLLEECPYLKEQLDMRTCALVSSRPADMLPLPQSFCCQRSQQASRF